MRGVATRIPERSGSYQVFVSSIFYPSISHRAGEVDLRTNRGEPIVYGQRGRLPCRRGADCRRWSELGVRGRDREDRGGSTRQHQADDRETVRSSRCRTATDTGGSERGGGGVFHARGGGWIGRGSSDSGRAV